MATASSREAAGAVQDSGVATTAEAAHVADAAQAATDPAHADLPASKQGAGVPTFRERGALHPVGRGGGAAGGGDDALEDRAVAAGEAEAAAQSAVLAPTASPADILASGAAAASAAVASEVAGRFSLADIKAAKADSPAPLNEIDLKKKEE
jgi:hypothetical protein